MSSQETRDFFIRDSTTWNGIPWRVDGHMHTKWTDGENSVEEMWKAAAFIGLEAALFSEHSRKGSGEWFGSFSREVRTLPKSSTQAFVGTECGILGTDGHINLDPLVAQDCDLVIASVHRFPSTTGQRLAFEDTPKEIVIETELSMMIAALEREEADVIGHPFGMSILRFGMEPEPEHWSALVKAASNSRTALEINSKYHSDLSVMLARYSQGDCRMSLGSDAHAVNRVGHAFGVLEKMTA